MGEDRETAGDPTSPIEGDLKNARRHAARTVADAAPGHEGASVADFGDAVRLGYDAASLQGEIDGQAEASQAR
jgi:hypothetical protein